MNPSRPILVFGSSGQLGKALLRQLGKKALGVNSKEADFCKSTTVLDLLEKTSPSCVINAAAYTQVDLAETHESLAYEINAHTPGIIAQQCAQRQIPFVHYSTEYVFSGEGKKPWKEDSLTGPLNAYGRSKLQGEKAIQSLDGHFLIFRTSWVYDASGKNFLTTMLKLGKTQPTLRIVHDQWGAPTYAEHLAQMSLKCLAKALEFRTFPSGIYNLCNEGETHWHEFAISIFRKARQNNFSLKVVDIQGINSKDYPTPAQRPLNSRLCLDKIKKVFGIQPDHWEMGLDECFKTLERCSHANPPPSNTRFKVS